MQRLRIWLYVLLLGSLTNIPTSFAGEIKPIPSLNDLLNAARTYFSGKNNSINLEEALFKIKKFYYQNQYLAQKLDTLNEVKGHFEKAVSKAEEKYEEGEEDISQSDITKLKLGLAGTLNDIYEIETDLQISRLSLSDSLDNRYSPNAELVESDISPINFEFNNFDAWEEKIGEPLGKLTRGLVLKKNFLQVIEAKKKMQLARKNRKMTRALLVSEVANYDFGIGDSGDLFQALIIYTRVLNGYYDSVYNFNLLVAKFDRDTKM
tara:strand:+ start:143 stop:934 length:792 start_codon:yes stop_codon:yes gene_type:complete